jgi:transposase
VSDRRSAQVDRVRLSIVLHLEVRRHGQPAVSGGCESAVVQAPAPARPIDGGMATEAMLAQVATMKYGYQVPLYRQEQMLVSQGIDLDRATLALWMGRLAWWLKPLHDVLLNTVLSHPKLFADETPLPVLDPGRIGRASRIASRPEHPYDRVR